ncbi:YciI family protein [Rathayibacter sp. AY1B8]|uniref:YciI family protein n=1 Tax=Rathayibacter sp. AY1B8 TaxID=2080533 RepID=UPI000CE76BCE|nr:YciI family protein [Rathayibacter sp. AY1B8]PPI06435.1 hypothetical protein C5C63_10295 [Rathayibacter sp. AY1B8]
MKIMLVMRSDGSYAGGDAPEDYAAWADYDASLKADGVLVDSGRFADASGDVSVETDLTAARRGSGTPAPSRAEERSALVGYYLLDCPTRDDAVRYARRAPPLRLGRRARAGAVLSPALRALAAAPGG